MSHEHGGLATAALVAMLEDIESIKQLKARYFRCVDGRRWDELRGLFTPDCTFHTGGRRKIGDRDDFIVRVQDLIHPGVSVHHGHMPEITITGTRSASGIWSMTDYVEVERQSGDRQGLVGHGHYIEEYARLPEGWRISRWELRRIRVVRIREGGLRLLSVSSDRCVPDPLRLLGRE